MKIAWLLLAHLSTASAWTVPVVNVHDGDTFATQIGMPEPLDRIEVRIRGVDTPELGGRSQCDAENRLAIKARAATMEMLDGGKARLENYGWDKYARILADVYVGKRNVGLTLIERGLAVPYDGHGPKKDWCEQ